MSTEDKEGINPCLIHSAAVSASLKLKYMKISSSFFFFLGTG